MKNMIKLVAVAAFMLAAMSVSAQVKIFQERRDDV